jgi:hypothetical protein
MLGDQPGIVDMCLTCVMRLPHYYQEEKQFDIMVVVSKTFSTQYIPHTKFTFEFEIRITFNNNYRSPPLSRVKPLSYINMLL